VSSSGSPAAASSGTVRVKPFVRDAGPYFQSRHWDRIFDLGLQIMLDGIVAARSKTT
jgi:hypothetical protein